MMTRRPAGKKTQGPFLFMFSLGSGHQEVAWLCILRLCFSTGKAGLGHLITGLLQRSWQSWEMSQTIPPRKECAGAPWWVLEGVQLVKNVAKLNTMEQSTVQGPDLLLWGLISVISLAL